MIEQAEVNASAGRNVNTVRHIVLAYLREAQDKFLPIVSAHTSIKQRDAGPVIDALMRDAGRFSSQIAPHIACRKKCSHCCHMAVAISTHEAEAISRATGIVAASVVSTEFNRAELVDRYTKVRCPFLNDIGACSVYEYRPLACRLNFNVSDYEYLCNVFTGRNSVPGLDLSSVEYIFVLAVMAGHMELADIRVFFPNVRFGEEVK